MLVKYCKGACAITAALTLMAGVAQADNQLVMIVDGGYFPAVTYAQPGDNIVFENKSAGDHVMRGPNDSWVSDPIAVDGRYVLNLTHSTPLTFTGTGTDGIEVAGEISYDEPPLTE
ncbi:hypothetical protein GV827_08355 [Sulfitobacter sp. JBTF-M27]|uniref:Plastocyanin n=1 Tax=Sulfitobacter sediminilitoris TaxID=2698830 RepID=A0A6P0CAN4_9RHOB|nr:hypothetical protein [Sulfitobacter sediminilitoris]NEK22410.1 hypothetical protein [Sulfitobacter sediminilitoris]